MNAMPITRGPAFASNVGSFANVLILIIPLNEFSPYVVNTDKELRHQFAYHTR
jgi:hypothetical protein